jgi:hypothetical protein
MDMKRYARKKILTGLLAVLWIFSFTAKSAHIHYSGVCSESPESPELPHHHDHDHDNCPVCQFILSSCVEAVSFRIDPVRTFVFITPASPQEKQYSRHYLYSSPRAPPQTVYRHSQFTNG